MERDILLSPRSIFKILIIGDHNTGKTSLLYKYLNFSYIANITTGYELNVHYLNLQNKNFCFTILDLSGHSSYNKMLEKLIQEYNSDAIIYVFDLSYHPSFANLDYWLDISNNKCSNSFNILIGNKSDKSERGVSSIKIKKFCKKNDLVYFETSVIDNNNIKEAFDFLFMNLIKQKDAIDNKPKIEQPKRNCCFINLNF